MVALIGYFVFHKAPAPVKPDSAVAAHTNRSLRQLRAPITSAEDVSAALAATNRPGAVKNLESEGSADDLNNTGVQLLDGGNAHKAIPVLQQAVSLKPDDETFHFNLAVAYMKMADSTNAEHEYKESLRLLPDYPEAHHNYGNLLARAGRMDEAEKHLTEAVNEMPQSAHYNNSLGVVQQRLKKTNEALLSFQKAVDNDTNLVEAHFNLAEAYLARHDRKKGIEQLLEALRIRPDFVPAKHALAGLTATP